MRGSTDPDTLETGEWIDSPRTAPAAEIHLSHFGQVMVSVPWIIALEQDLFRKNGVDVTDVITSQGGRHHAAQHACGWGAVCRCGDRRHRDRLRCRSTGLV
jgi:hypothetical protein